MSSTSNEETRGNDSNVEPPKPDTPPASPLDESLLLVGGSSPSSGTDTSSANNIDKTTSSSTSSLIPIPSTKMDKQRRLHEDELLLKLIDDFRNSDAYVEGEDTYMDWKKIALFVKNQNNQETIRVFDSLIVKGAQNEYRKLHRRVHRAKQQRDKRKILVQRKNNKKPVKGFKEVKASENEIKYAMIFATVLNKKAEMTTQQLEISEADKKFLSFRKKRCVISWTALAAVVSSELKLPFVREGRAWRNKFMKMQAEKELAELIVGYEQSEEFKALKRRLNIN